MRLLARWTGVVGFVMDELKALILAAGKGARMKSDRPKVLFEANGLPLLSYPMAAARDAGASEVIAVVGAGRELVKEAFVRDAVTWVAQERQLGTGHAVMCAREALAGFEGLVVVLCGDAPLVRAETISRLCRHTAEKGAACTVLTSEVDDPTGYGRIVRGDEGVRAIVEEKDASDEEKAVREINSGAYCFRWPELDAVLDRLSDDNAQGEYLLTDAIALLLEGPGRVEALVCGDPHEALGVNTRAQLAQVSRVLRGRVCERLMEVGVTIVDPASAFIDARAEIGVDTVIEPFVVIEGPVKIGARCRIGPFTHIRGASELADEVALGNFVEVTRSRFGAGSRARHLSFVGDAKIGEDVNVAAGVITANSDGRERYVTEIGDGASLGAGTVLVAPCRVDSGGATGSGAVVTRGKTVPSGRVWVGVPARELEKGASEDG